MKMFVLFAVSALCMTSAAFAADTCDAQATAKNLSGAAKTSFTKKCEADAKQAGRPTCDAQAASKKLAGAAKTSFVKKCETDSKAAGAQASCESQAKDKKLAGAAKNSFVKKCVTDATG